MSSKNRLIVGINISMICELLKKYKLLMRQANKIDNPSAICLIKIGLFERKIFTPYLRLFNFIYFSVLFSQLSKNGICS